MEKQSTRKFLKLIVALVALFLLGASALMLASCKDEHVHSYDAGVVTTQPTCNAPGSKTFTCSECGAVYTEVIPATNDHAWEKIKVYANSCESEGWTVYECSVCHDQKQDDWTPKLDHQYVLVEDESSEATCTEAGYRTYECSYCKSRYTDNQYTAQNPALGHDWIENTDAKETIPAAVLEQLGYKADQSDQAKKDGWGVSAAATCTTDAVYQRVCARCGKEDPKTISNSKLGHLAAGMDATLTLADGNAYTTALNTALANLGQAVCLGDEDLFDVDGNTYAYECVREGCTCSVTVNDGGDTKHYVAPVDHTYPNDGKYEVTKPATCDEDGSEKRVCSVCEYEDVQVIKSEGHKFNSVQLDGENAVIKCEADPKLAEDNGGLKAYLDYMRKAWNDVDKYNTEYDNLLAKYDAVYGADKEASAICSVCGNLQIAEGHDWGYAKLQDGKYNNTDYVKDDEGKPVIVEGIDDKNADCTYVKVCANGCGVVLGRADHDSEKITTATCRSGGYCEVCGQQITAQKSHEYLEVSQILDTKTNADTEKWNGTEITYKDIRDAYNAVKADNGFMTPVEATCTSAGTKVWLCVHCLIDASKGEEFDWTTGTLTADSNETPSNPNYTNSSYVMNVSSGHDYETVYFDLKAATTDEANRKDRGWSNCEFGFKVAYICKDCGHVYSNELVADDATTTDKDESDANEQQTISLDGKQVSAGFTNAAGFILDVTDCGDVKDELTAEAIAKAVEEDHRQAHSVYIPKNYDLSNATKDPTCTSAAMFYVVCEHCGAVLSYSYDELVAEFLDGNHADDTNNFNLVNGAKFVTDDSGAALVDPDNKTNVKAFVYGTGDDAVTVSLGNDVKPDPDNHAGNTYACGTHCDAKVDGKFACHGFTAEQLEAQTGIATMDHSTVEVTYLFSTMVTFTEGYTLQIADVDDDALVTETTTEPASTTYSIDFTKAKLLATDKASKCAETATVGNNYTLPSAYAGEKTDAAYKLGKYLVVVDEDNNVYGLNNFKLYAEDAKGATPLSGDTIEVTQNDQFFVRFGDGDTAEAIPGVPVKADDSASLKQAFAKNPVVEDEKGNKTVTVEVATDITLGAAETIESLLTDRTDAAVVVELNGNTITQSAKGTYTISAGSNVTFKNGELAFTDKTAASNQCVLNPYGASKLTLDGVKLTTGTGMGIYAQYDASNNKHPEIVINDSEIIAGGSYGIGTNAGNKTYSNDVLLTVTNSTITAGSATVPGTALFINVPATVKVSGSTMNANYQVVVVRGGDVEIVNSTLNLLNTYTEDSVEVQMAAWLEEEDNTGKTEAEAWAAVVGGDTSISTIKAYRYGFTMQVYRLGGLWATGNGVPRAVITVGNSNTSAYQYTSKLTVSASVEVNNETSFPNLVIGSYYGSSLAEAEQPTVTVSVPSTNVWTPVYCSNFQSGTISFNGVVVNK